MNHLFLFFALLSFYSPSVQHVYYYKEYNVYNKDAEIILDYAAEFVKHNRDFFIHSESDSVFSGDLQYDRTDEEIVVHSIFLMKRSPKFCFGSMVLNMDIVFMAKYGRTRMELRDIKYYIIPSGGTSKCSGSGDYETLKASDCCKRTDYIVEALIRHCVEISDKYKKLLKSKNGTSGR